MSNRSYISLLFAAAAVLSLSTWGFGQDNSTPSPPPLSRAAEIHKACEKGGVKVKTVRQDAQGNYSVVCATGGSQAEADVIMRRVLATEPPGQTSVTTVQDALVVIRFEPNNKRANELLEARYDQLRAAHLRKKDGK